MDAYEAAQEFDKSYTGYRIDVYAPEEDHRVAVVFKFKFGNCAAAAILSANREIYTGMAHQVRPFGKTVLDEDTVENDFAVTIYLDERKISDIGTTILLTKLTTLADELVVRHGMA